MATETAYVSLASAVTASAISLTGYYPSIAVTNLTEQGATGATPIWVRADGIAAVTEADGAFAIASGQTLILNNGEPLWSQGLANVPVGVLVGGVGTGTPAVVMPYGSSLAGGIANPGTHVSVILDNGVGPVQVAVASND